MSDFLPPILTRAFSGSRFSAAFCLSVRPQSLLTRGEGCLVEARVCRMHRWQSSGELEAIRVSESLPFMVCACPCLWRFLLRWLSNVNGVLAVVGRRCAYRDASHHRADRDLLLYII